MGQLRVVAVVGDARVGYGQEELWGEGVPLYALLSLEKEWREARAKAVSMNEPADQHNPRTDTTD